MTNVDILAATNFWWSERKDRSAHHSILRIMPLLFQTVQSLFIETRKLPLHSVSGASSVCVNGECNYIWYFSYTLSLFNAEIHFVFNG
jgi:hypothetical protein